MVKPLYTLIKSMLVACFFLPFNLLAQNDVDLLRLSETNFGSTARSLSMGGAFGAVGADFSSFAFNPAGIAVYRKSEFTFSPVITSRNADAEYLGNTPNFSKTGFGIGNIGVVYAYPSPRSKDWKAINFGFGYNRTTSFRQEFGGLGNNLTSSLIDGFINKANGTHPGNLANANFSDDVLLAYNTYLIDPIPSDSSMYLGAIPAGGIEQDFIISSKGSSGDITFGVGANYQNKLMVGLSMAFPTFSYTRDLKWTETDVGDTVVGPLSIYDINSFTYDQTVESSGTGFNIKMGLIYRVHDNVRLGASIHSPSWYEISDEYFNTMTSNFDSSLTLIDESQRLFDYNVRTPFKAGASAAYLFGKQGMISVDFEYVDYSDMKLKSDFYSFNTENNIVSEKYTNTSNIRVGGEYRYREFSFRGGYALYGSPFKSDIADSNFNLEKTSYSAGIGYRNDKVFVDLGYALTEWGEFYQPYSAENVPVEGIKNEYSEHRMMITFGARF